jgi:hypothetical protein
MNTKQIRLTTTAITRENSNTTIRKKKQNRTPKTHTKILLFHFTCLQNFSTLHIITRTKLFRDRQIYGRANKHGFTSPEITS